MEETFQAFAEYVALILEAISIVIVATGGIEAGWRLLRPLFRGQVSQGRRRAHALIRARSRPGREEAAAQWRTVNFARPACTTHIPIGANVRNTP